MENPDDLAARALLQQLRSNARAPVARNDRSPQLDPAPSPDKSSEQDMVAPDETDSTAIPPWSRWQPDAPEATDTCEVCGATVDPSLEWCRRCLTGRHAPVVTAAPAPICASREVTDEEIRPEVAKSAIWLVIAVIALNIVVQAVTYGMERSAWVTPNTAIAIGLWVGLGFYGVVALFALRTRAAAFVRTVWTIGNPRIALRNGLLVGAGASLTVLGLQSLATHQLVGDPNVRLVVSGGSGWRILAAFVLFVAVAPLVEEYIFRGVLAESLRGRGITTATAISALLFALAHLRPASLIYYSLIGVILGRLYFRFGLKASVAAHAIFNGLLVVAAMFTVLGPAKTYVDDGAALRLPAAWSSVHQPPTSPYQFVARGPSGAAILILDRQVPTGVTFIPASFEAAARNGELPLPAGASVTSASTVSYPAGTAAALSLTVQGQPGRVVVMVEHNREWVFVVSTAGSPKAAANFEQMMQKLTLP